MSLENEIVDYKKHQLDIEHWVTLKGEYRYKSIIGFLRANNIDCTWDNVTYYIKYDKRLLINSFKYVVFLEEMYKSFILNTNQFNSKEVLRWHFEKTLHEYLRLNNNGYDGIDLLLMKNEKESINRFRNAISHNQILIGQTFKGKSLEEVLQIFVKILPKSYRKGFISDINSCSKGLIEDKWHITLSLEE